MPSPKDQEPSDLYIPPFSDNFGEDGFVADLTKVTAIPTRTGEFRVVAGLLSVQATGTVWSWRLYFWDHKTNTGTVCGNGKYLTSTGQIELNEGLVLVDVLTKIQSWLGKELRCQQR